jgi:hypothetical protein
MKQGDRAIKGCLLVSARDWEIDGTDAGRIRRGVFMLSDRAGKE